MLRSKKPARAISNLFPLVKRKTVRMAPSLIRERPNVQILGEQLSSLMIMNVLWHFVIYRVNCVNPSTVLQGQYFLILFVCRL